MDRSLIKNVLAIYQEVGMGQMDCYERDFEEPMLKATADYYRRKAAVWVQVRLALPGQVDETRRVWHGKLRAHAVAARSSGATEVWLVTCHEHEPPGASALAARLTVSRRSQPSLHEAAVDGCLDLLPTWRIALID